MVHPTHEQLQRMQSMFRRITLHHHARHHHSAAVAVWQHMCRAWLAAMQLDATFDMQKAPSAHRCACTRRSRPTARCTCPAICCKQTDGGLAAAAAVVSPISAGAAPLPQPDPSSVPLDSASAAVSSTVTAAPLSAPAPAEATISIPVSTPAPADQAEATPAAPAVTPVTTDPPAAAAAADQYASDQAATGQVVYAAAGVSLCDAPQLYSDCICLKMVLFGKVCAFHAYAR